MFVLKKRSLVIICVLVITALTFVLCFGALAVKTVSNAETNKITVVIDAGHGGIDGGVSGVNTGVKESELNLIVSKKLKELLVNSDIKVVLTRETESGLYGIATASLKKKDMKKRKEIIENAKPNLVISIHMNEFSSSTRRGAQVFYKEGDESGKKLANLIQNSFNSMEKAVKEYSPLSGDYYILNCSNIPSVICECGFLSNPTDESLLITDDYQNEISYAIYKGIVNYLTESSSLFINENIQ